MEISFVKFQVSIKHFTTLWLPVWWGKYVQVSVQKPWVYRPAFGELLKSLVGRLLSIIAAIMISIYDTTLSFTCWCNSHQVFYNRVALLCNSSERHLQVFELKLLNKFQKLFQGFQLHPVAVFRLKIFLWRALSCWLGLVKWQTHPVLLPLCAANCTRSCNSIRVV